MLFYVGMIQAKKFLFLSYAEKRFLYGRQYRLARSPFLSAIEERLTKMSRAQASASRRKTPKVQGLVDLTK